MKKNFQRCAVAHGVAFHMYILEVGSLLLWKFGLGCYTPFCSSLVLRAADRRLKTNQRTLNKLFTDYYWGVLEGFSLI